MSHNTKEKEWYLLYDYTAGFKERFDGYPICGLNNVKKDIKKINKGNLALKTVFKLVPVGRTIGNQYFPLHGT